MPPGKQQLILVGIKLWFYGSLFYREYHSLLFSIEGEVCFRPRTGVRHDRSASAILQKLSAMRGNAREIFRPD
jgi:hypothetical protein